MGSRLSAFGFWRARHVAAVRNQIFDETAVERGSNRQHEFEGAAELGRRLQNRRQIHSHFFDSAAGHQRNPVLFGIQVVLAGIFGAVNFGTRQVRKRMANEGGVYTAITIELFFKWKDDEGFLYVFAQELYPPLSPGPKLRAHVIDDRNASLMHLPGDPPVECGRINDYG